MQEIITTTKTKTKITNKEVLVTLLNLLIDRGYTFNSSIEIKNAIDKQFKADISIDLIEELWIEGREIDDTFYQLKNLNLYQ